MYIGTRADSEGESLWQFELLLWGISLGFPVTDHFDLPGSQFIFGMSQDPPMSMHASLNKDGFYQKCVSVGNIP